MRFSRIVESIILMFLICEVKAAPEVTASSAVSFSAGAGEDVDDISLADPLADDGVVVTDVIGDRDIPATEPAQFPGRAVAPLLAVRRDQVEQDEFSETFAGSGEFSRGDLFG